MNTGTNPEDILKSSNDLVVVSESQRILEGRRFEHIYKGKTVVVIPNWVIDAVKSGRIN